MEYPHANVDTHSPELFIRDIEFLNWHINHDKWGWFKYYTMPYAHRLELDFCCFDSDCWTTTTTEQGSGSATETCIDAVNGVLQITNAGADNDLDELVYGCECFQLVDNFELYAEVRLRVDDPDNADWWFGLITGNSFFTPPNDYVVFFGDVATGGDSVYFANAFNGHDPLVHLHRCPGGRLLRRHRVGDNLHRAGRRAQRRFRDKERRGRCPQPGHRLPLRCAEAGDHLIGVRDYKQPASLSKPAGRASLYRKNGVVYGELH